MAGRAVLGEDALTRGGEVLGPAVLAGGVTDTVLPAS